MADSRSDRKEGTMEGLDLTKEHSKEQAQDHNTGTYLNIQGLFYTADKIV